MLELLYHKGNNLVTTVADASIFLKKYLRLQFQRKTLKENIISQAL